MYGVIFLWRVRPEQRAEHAATMRRVLQAERERAPEVLLNLTFGPAEDGTCAEIQVYADEATQRAFPERVAREDAELQALWERFGELCEPDAWRTIRFESLSFLSESFLREGVGLRLPDA